MRAISQLFALCTSSADSVRTQPNYPTEAPPAKQERFDEVFDIGEQIGKGGFSMVHIAHNRCTGDKVAVKIAQRVQLQDNMAAWQQEFDILRKLTHQNIVRAFGMYEEPDKLFMVLEYMEGGELFDRIVERKKYTEDIAQEAFRAILKGIEYFHSHGIIHRDLKPENLLLSSKENDTNVKVADFGLARFLREGELLISRAGTPDYIAPEVVSGQPLTKAVDMWAAGVILFILLGGYSPFHKKEKGQMFQRIANAQYTFHPQRWDTISQEAKDMVAKLLQVDPNARLTARQALEHPWLAQFPELASDLSGNLPVLRQFNAMRKLRGSVHAVIMTNRMKKLVTKEMDEMEGINEGDADRTEV